jgi:hypothetical protein
VPGTVLFIQHHSYAPPAMLGEAFTEAGYDVGVLALPDTGSETAEFPSRRGRRSGAGSLLRRPATRAGAPA